MKRWLGKLLALAAVGIATTQIGCGLAEPLVFEVLPANLDLKVGEIAQLQVRVLDANGEFVPDRTASYLSVNPGVATVSASGLVTAVSSGATQITLSAEGVSGSVPVTVIPTMTGSWSGSVSTAGTSFFLDLTVIESATESIAGTGVFRISNVGIPFTVAGTHFHPAVELTLSVSGLDPARLTGQFTGDNVISAQLFDSGFSGEPVTLLRQSSALASPLLTDSPKAGNLVEAILAALHKGDG